MDEAVLCYCEGPWAYFTTQALHKQWGDDWNDVSYEDNASPPYRPCWHNSPGQLCSSHRGNVKPGELCRDPCCIDDWNDDGTPKFRIIKIAWDDVELLQPRDLGRYSVADINAGAVPWLSTPSWRPPKQLFAGATIGEFCKFIRGLGGKVFTEERQNE